MLPSIDCIPRLMRETASNPHVSSFAQVKVEHFSESFYKPFSLYESNMIDHIIRGMIKSHAQSEDVHVIGDMTNKMFMNSSSGMGLDLVSQVHGTSPMVS